MKTRAITKEKLFTRDFLLIFLAAGMIRVSYQMQNTLMPLYMDQLGYSATRIGMSTTSSTIASLVLRPMLGGMLDRYGRRGLVLAGTALFAVATLLCGFWGGFAVLLALRALQGLGFSAHTTAVNTMATDVLPEERMSEGIGYMGLTGSVSSAIAPAVAMFFAASALYTWGFAAAFAAGAVSVLCLMLIRSPDVKSVAPPDGEKPTLLSRLWEKSAVRPTVIMLILGACSAGTGTFLAVYAVGRGYHPAQVSLYFTLNALATVAARLFGPRLSRLLGLKKTLVAVMAFSVAGYLLIPFSIAAWGLWVAAILQGLSYGTIYPMMNAMAVTGAAPHRRGTAMATFLTGMDIGMGFGASFWGTVIDAVGIDSMFPMCAGIAVIVYIACRVLIVPREELGTARSI